MTLIFTDGFQDAGVAPKPEWDPGVIWVAVTGRDGTANSAAYIGAASGAFKTATFAAPISTAIAGVAYQPLNSNMLGNSDATVMGFVRAGVQELCFRVNTGGFIEARRLNAVGALIGTSSGHTPLALNVWRHLAFKTVLHSSTGLIEVRIDDVPVLTLPSVATAATSGSIAGIRITAPNSSSNQHIFDDLYVVDITDGTATDGRPNNDFIGDVKIATLLPTGAGDTTSWVPSTGANWDAVNENPANTTDYVSTSTPAARDLYAHADLPAAAVSVLGVRGGFYAAKTDAGAATVKHVIKEGGVVTVGSGKPLSVSYTGYWGDLIKLKPSGAAVFTVADVNAMQAGVELA